MWWLSSGTDLLRIVAVGAAAYVSLVVILRLSGKRTLAKLNAFDLVVTVALGSTLATIVLSSQVSWAEGVVALALLAGLQMVVAAVTSRVGGRAALTAEPTLLLRDGRLLEQALHDQRMTPAEVRQAVRASGMGDLGAVGAAVLETDGSLSVIPASRMGDGSALADLPGESLY